MGTDVKKGKKWKKRESSGEESEDKVIGIEMGSELDSKNEKKVVKKSEKREVRTRKVWFEEERRKGKDVQGQVDELTRKLLQLDIKDNAYTMAYTQLFVLASNLTDKLPPVRESLRGNILKLGKGPIS